MGLFNSWSDTRKYNWEAEQNQLDREWNLMLAEQENQWNIEQWERENEYNSASNQVARLKAAGLNADLAYGSVDSSSSSSVAGNLTSGQGASHSSPSGTSNPAQALEALNNSFSSMMDNAVKAAQVRNIESDTEFNLRSMPDRLTGIGLQNQNTEADTEDKKSHKSLNNSQIALNEANMSLAGAQYNYVQQQWANLHLEGQQLQAKKKYFNDMAELEYKTAQSQFALLIAHRLNLIDDAALKRAQKKFVESQDNGQQYLNDIQYYEACAAGQKREFLEKHPNYTPAMMYGEIGAAYTGALGSLLGAFK